ncbi:MAG: transketolase C-terminal domain-containing protein [archaeon]
MNMQPKKGEMIATREGYGNAIAELGEKNKNIVVLDADLAKSTRSYNFGKKFPKRFWYMGISEADTICTAAGLALSGKIAFASSFAVFITNRAYDQIRMSVCYSNANVKIIGSHGGIITGADGPSAQGILDISTMRTMPLMRVFVPADFYEAKKATFAMAQSEGPAYMRTTREGIPVLFDDSLEFKIGKGMVLVDGSDAAIIACGELVSQALLAAKSLKKEKISAAVINMASVKPIDRELIAKFAKKTNFFVTAEDAVINGGLGSAVCEVLAETSPARVKRIGLDNTFAESGKPADLLKKYKMDADAIVQAVKYGLKN